MKKIAVCCNRAASEKVHEFMMCGRNEELGTLTKCSNSLKNRYGLHMLQGYVHMLIVENKH